MWEGWQKYEDTLHTTWPDLTPFQAAGGIVLHFHGESDNSIPTISSVRYHESIRQIIYPNMSFNESTERSAIGIVYSLYLVQRTARLILPSRMGHFRRLIWQSLLIRWRRELYRRRLMLRSCKGAMLGRMCRFVHGRWDRIGRIMGRLWNSA